MKTSDRIIFPLDGMDLDEAEKWMFWLKGRIGYVKIGLEMFLRSGWEAVSVAHGHGHKVMLDLKIHDIPATMVAATRRAVEANVALFTVHASAGPKAMRWCVGAARDTETSIVAVTVLTSLNEEFIQQTYQPLRHEAGCIPNIVENLVTSATQDGCVDHFVCSPHEVGLIRAVRAQSKPAFDATIITPGIRMADGEKHDQERVATPGATVKAGADYLVIGRPIREAEDPGKAIEAICADIEGCNDEVGNRERDGVPGGQQNQPNV